MFPLNRNNSISCLQWRLCQATMGINLRYNQRRGLAVFLQLQPQVRGLCLFFDHNFDEFALRGCHGCSGYSDGLVVRFGLITLADQTIWCCMVEVLLCVVRPLCFADNGTKCLLSCFVFGVSREGRIVSRMMVYCIRDLFFPKRPPIII